MKITFSRLFRCAGLAAIASGLLFLVIQAIHPADIMSSVGTARWAVVHLLSIAMGLLGMLGITGIYLKQAEKAGSLGLIGYLLLSLFYALTMAFQFVEAFISPQLATEAPKFVESLLALAGGSSAELSLGALAAVFMLTGALYLLGGLLFGIATLRARILSRWAGGILAVGTLLPLLFSQLVHHPYDRIFAVPVGVGIAWLGFSLWSAAKASAKPAKA
ncbi:MAG: hypothetical protein K0Q59_1241 [Paenibacillus sp.]|jgi:hypothetical protein|nr:hypothetical protein [Paenibacillus sp.]